MIDFEGFKYVIVNKVNKASKGVVHLTDIAPTIGLSYSVPSRPVIAIKGREFDFKLYEVVQNPELTGDENE
jgi:hypothetical protein